jgi:hypothetical protein
MNLHTTTTQGRLFKPEENLLFSKLTRLLVALQNFTALAL